MEGEHWQKVKALFDAASHIAVDKRDRFLADACGGDRKLAREVKKLLASLDEAETFLEQPAAADAASMFDGLETLVDDKTTGDLDSANLAVGSVLAGRYRILDLLGRGGMGEVYKAEDIKLTQTVALKFLPDRLARDKGALARFHAEVRMARQVSHPNVCRVFDIGEFDGRHFISMEYIHGDDLSSMLRRIGRLASDKAIVISRQLCFGLAAIHDAGILHRDLKPANIIIDDNGKARITDFGIAGIEVEMEGSETRIGTPAYMSPEQIKGKGVSQRSDIYSLGLLLYEIFTGKQTFQADSMIDLLVKQETTAPTNPSELLKDIDPVVERTILQCLEKNADDRPKTALQVAMMLPGGNPLEAAIAAGQTPSPEMVAAAPKKGALKPPVAVACLSVAVGLFAFIVFFSGSVKHNERIPLEKSPEVLAERASTILRKIGYPNTAVDTDFGFDANLDYYSYASRNGSDPNRWEKMRSGQPAVIYFWHRTSPRYLEPGQTASVAPDDPPNDVAGMTRVILDPLGRLLEFQAVPPQVRSETAFSGETNWADFFTEAGMDIRNYRNSGVTNWTPPVFADASGSWEGVHVDHPDVSIRVEAAAFQGKPVYFHVIAPWDKPVRQEESESRGPVRVAGILLITFFMLVIIAAIFLAIYNLRHGRSDARGAFKITVFVFVMSLAANMLVADHIPDLARELEVLRKTAGTALLLASLIGLILLALEPYVRRSWPSLLISWNRLLAGDWRDPLVGRDILVGGIFGLSHTTVIFSMFLLTALQGAQAPNPSLEVETLNGLQFALASSIGFLTAEIFLSVSAMLLLVLVVTIFRKRWLAIAVCWLAYFSVLSLFFAVGGHWTAWIGIPAISTITLICIARFGLLATVSFYLFFHLSFHFPITTDVSRWYFAQTIFSAVVLLGLAAFGFYTSLAKQSIFGGRIFRDVE